MESEFSVSILINILLLKGGVQAPGRISWVQKERRDPLGTTGPTDQYECVRWASHRNYGIY